MTNVGAGDAFTLAADVGLQDYAFRALMSSTGNGSTATGRVNIEVGRMVGGLNNDLFDSAALNESSYIYIEKTGNVFSDAGGKGIFVQGTGGSDTIQNAGSIQSIVSNG